MKKITLLLFLISLNVFSQPVITGRQGGTGIANPNKTITLGSSIVWPSNSTGALNNNGSGTLSWIAPTYTTPLIFNLPLSVSSGTVSITDASASVSGVVNTTTQTFAGNKTFTGDLTVGGNITFSATTNSSLSGSNARIPSHTSSNIVFTNAGLISIASANNGGVLDGHVLVITNATGGSLTIINSYTAAAAGESILTGDGNLTIPSGLSLLLNYESTVSAWTVGNGGTFQPKLSVTAPITLSSNTLALTSTGSNSVVLSTGATLTTPTLGVASATSLAITGTAGNGFISLATQTATPSAPGSGTVLFSNNNSKLSWRGSANNFVKTFDGGLATADRVYSLPNRNVMIDSLTTSTSTALNGFIKGNGSVISSVSSTGTGNVVLNSGASITSATVTSSDLSSTTNIFPIYPLLPIVSGKYRSILYAGQASSSTGWNGKIWAIPYEVEYTHTVTDIGLEVTASAATSTLTLALYTDSLGSIGHLVEASGNLSSTTTGLKTYTFSSPHTLNAGQYWLALQESSSSVGLRQAPANGNIETSYLNGSGTNVAAGQFTQSFGAFPSHFNFGANNVGYPLISLKIQ